MKLSTLFLLLSGAAAGAINVPLTVQEALVPGSFTGVARNNEPVTVGVPIPDSAAIRSVSTLALAGASAAQFSVEGTWPDGNIKWLKVRAIVPSIAAGGTVTLTLTDSGSGNFGGANLATDNGSTISINTTGGTCGAGNAICFTLKKANFNGIDSMQAGSATLVSPGASQGLTVLGPDPTAAYPGNVTCSPTAGGTACTTVYQSSNDPASTCSIEENGPAAAVVKCAGDLVDGASHKYMHFTTRLYFFQNKSYVKITPILRNADYGTSNTFASASKGLQGFELRVTPNLSGSLNYKIANHTATPTAGALNRTAGTDSVYIYQAESNWLKSSSWCGYGCVASSTLSGYSIVSNGSAVLTGTASQYPQGWADISDASGAGMEIGQEQFAGYGNKSLEFLGGGGDVRIGIWARENNTTGTSATAPAAPYYMAWPQWSIPSDIYLNFHAASDATLANDFLTLQYPLLARADNSWYNTSAVFPYPLPSASEEDAYYSSVVSSATPSVRAVTASDVPAGSTSTADTLCSDFVCIFRFYPWPAPGGSNQMEFRLGHVFNFLRRGYTGGYLNAMYFYKFAVASAFPMADGFTWSSRPSAEHQYYNYPTAASANSSRISHDWVEADMEHGNIQGFPDFYFLSGDETIKDAVVEGYKDAFLDNTSTNNYTTISPAIWNDRAIGNVLKSIAHLYNFLSAIGDPDAAKIRANGETVFNVRLRPDFCAAAGYPAGCTPDGVDNNDNNTLQVGTSTARGVTNIYRDTSVTIDPACGSAISSGARSAASFMNSIKLEGMWEFYKIETPAWPYYNQLFDYAYGSAEWAFHEMYVDNGQQSWQGNGFRYKQAIDYPNACNGADDWGVKNEQTVWFPFFIRHQYEGGTSWKHEFEMLIQRDLSDTSTDEFFYQTMGAVVYDVLHPQPAVLATVPIAGFKDNGGGSYTVTWSVPSGAISYRIKWGTKQIVDWVGFDAGQHAFTGNPATTMNWFAATDAANIPAPSGTTQSLTIATGATGLTAGNFMVKAYTTGGGSSSPADTTAPSVTITSPAASATLSGTFAVTANATDNVGVASVQFQLDGSPLGSAVISGTASYTTSWDTTKVSDGTHVLSATAADAAGNVGVSAAVSITVKNGATSDFTLTPAPASQSVSAGASTSFVLTIAGLNGFTGTTTFSASGLPSGVTAGFSPSSVTGGGSTSMSITVGSGVAAGNYSATITATSGSGSHTASVTLSVSSTGSSGSGTAVPLNTWTALPSTGWPAEIMNYDKSEYITSRNVHCIWGAYRQYLSSEHNNAIVCYSYSEGRWSILDNSGYWHGTHSPSVGHSVSIWAYMNDQDSIAFQTDGSGSNSPENLGGFWWWYDVGGLSGQNRSFSPRPWLGVQTPLVEMMTYNQYAQKLILYDQVGAIEVCNPATNSCAKPSISGAQIPATLTSGNMVYNSNDHKMYIYGGDNTGVYTLACNTTACTTATAAQLQVTCKGADCTNGAPPIRLAAGMAYSSKDNVFLMVGGIPNYASSSAYSDTWVFDPVASIWTELSPASQYPTSRTYFTADRLTYDPVNNVFLLIAVNGYTPLPYAFAYSAAANAATVSRSYTPPAGALNRAAPTSASQSWAFDPAIAASGSKVYMGWVESGASGDQSTCGMTHHPFIQSTSDNATWTYYPGGTTTQACLAIDPELSGNTNDSKLRLAVVNGALWEAHEKINHNQSYYSAAFAHQWSGSAWVGGAVGCFYAACGAKIRQNPQALIGAGNVPTLADIEWNQNTYTPEGYLYVSQWNGSAWSALGQKLNINGTGSQVLDATLATDGTYPAACWSEQVVASDRSTVTTTPQIQCAKWGGSSWTRWGSSSLNQNASAWASDPSMTYLGGNFYIGWTERITGSVNKLFVCRWDGASCTLLGGGPLNNNPTTGWAAHPSLATDGTNLYVAWEEQGTQGQHSMGYVKKWDGSAWSSVGGALNADPVNGSVAGIALAVAQGSPTAIWSELTYGSLRQAYEKQWNGTAWVGSSSSQTPPTVSCDLNGDGKVDAADVQIATSQALGTMPCSSADLQQNGTCTVVGVQRVISASLGGACRIGN